MDKEKSGGKSLHTGNGGPVNMRSPGWIVVIVMLIGIIFLVVRNYERFNKELIIRKIRTILSPGDAMLEKCIANMKNISTALEMYCCDNGGKYPDSLSKLTPEYLQVIPTCPSAKKDTYSSEYYVNKKRDFFCFSCGGSNHLNKGLPPNFPRANSTSVLTYYSGEMNDFVRLYEINNINRKLNSDPSVLNRQFTDGDTPLHIAVRNNFNEVIIPFLQKGAEINALNYAEQTPLHIAAFMGHYKMAELLLNRGATANIRDLEGKTPSDIAVENGNDDIVKLLKDSRFTKNYIPKNPERNLEICKNNLYKIYDALDRYCDDHEGTYPDRLSQLVPKYLKAIPTCPSAGRDTYSATYHPAIKAKFFDFSCGGNNHRDMGLLPNFPRVNLTTYLTVRSGDIDDDIRFYNYKEIMKKLAQDPGYAKRKGSAERTPLHYAAEYNFNEIIIPLLEKGADINAVDEYGRTPLHQAVYYEHYKTIKLLLEKGANKNIKDKEGMTPLDIAKKENFDDIVILLKGE